MMPYPTTTTPVHSPAEVAPAQLPFVTLGGDALLAIASTLDAFDGPAAGPAMLADAVREAVNAFREARAVRPLELDHTDTRASVAALQALQVIETIGPLLHEIRLGLAEYVATSVNCAEHGPPHRDAIQAAGFRLTVRPAEPSTGEMLREMIGRMAERAELEKAADAASRGEVS